MRAVWDLEKATVEQVRAALPKRSRPAYNTVQTVLNRLAERGLLARKKKGNAMVYTPRMQESEYIARSMQDELAAASTDARKAALASLVGGLDAGELDEITKLARDLDARRKA